jgi:ribosome-binding factor A
MTQSTVKTIKQAKKTALLFRELSQLFMRLTMDEPRLENLFISRVEMSRDGGICFILFYTPDGEKKFNEQLPILILYKPSLRKALSQQIAGRYTPELVFKFDDKFEKQSKLEALLDKIKTEEEPS